ncbi:T9SS type A sorting domain-containing protein [Flammeovirga kamogawensis]|uniref:T9SS type A sorting domain-containing protein n=1 Tax=Flammeovirga kamogawensis TaxID=373891 RepID=UPI0013152AC8|nr:T9SS type A sorting domain-containing protein [Flammeovirga kamogawensis]
MRLITFLLLTTQLTTQSFAQKLKSTTIEIIGTAVPSTISSYPMFKSKQDNTFEALVYLDKSKTFQFKLSDGTVFGGSETYNLLSENGSQIPINNIGPSSVFHVSVNGENGEYKIRQIETLGFVSKTNENKKWSNEIPLTLNFDEDRKTLTYSYDKVIRLQDKFRIIANHDIDYYWSGYSISNQGYYSGLPDGVSKKDALSEVILTSYLNEGLLELSMNTDTHHTVSNFSLNQDDYLIIDTSLDEQGAKYQIGTCITCTDNISFISKENTEGITQKFLNLPFEIKRGHSLSVSSDGSTIAILIPRRNNQDVIYDGVNYLKDENSKLILLILDSSLNIITTKDIHISLNDDEINKNGYDVVIDKENDIYTHVYIPSNSITNNEINESINHDAGIVNTRWSNNGSFIWSKIFQLENPTEFVTSLFTLDESDNYYMALDILFDNIYLDGFTITFNTIHANRSNLVMIDGSTINGSKGGLSEINNIKNDNNLAHSTIFSLEGGKNRAYFAGTQNSSETVYFYQDFRQIYNANYCYYIGNYNRDINSSGDGVIQIVHNNGFEELTSEMKLYVDDEDNCYATFEVKPFTTIYHRSYEKKYRFTKNEGVGVLKLSAKDGTLGVYTSQGYLTGKDFNPAISSIIVDNSSISLEGTISNSFSYHINGVSNNETVNKEEAFELKFELPTFNSSLNNDKYWASNSFKIIGDAINFESSSLSRTSENNYEGFISLKSNYNINLQNENGDLFTIDKDGHISYGDTPILIEGLKDSSVFYINLDYQSQKLVIKEINNVGIISRDINNKNKIYELNYEENFSDIGLAKFHSNNLLIPEAYSFIINNDTNFVFGEKNTIDKLPIIEAPNSKGNLIAYFDYKNNKFSYEVIKEGQAQVTDVIVNNKYVYEAVESDDNSTIYRVGNFIDKSEGAVLEKIDINGIVQNTASISLSSPPRFGNNFKVDPTTGKMILSLENSNNKTSFTYDEVSYSIKSTSTLILLYIDSNLNLITYQESESLIQGDDYSVTIDNKGDAYYLESIQAPNSSKNFNIYKFNESSFNLLNTITATDNRTHYIAMITVDETGHLYFNGETYFDELLVNNKNVIDGNTSGCPLLNFDSETGKLNWAKPLIKGTDGRLSNGWATGFQAGENSVYISGWVLNYDSIIDDIIDPAKHTYFSNYIIEIDAEGNALWGDLLGNSNNTYNFGYTRLEVDKEDNVYYMLDARSEILPFYNNNTPILFNENRGVNKTILKYNKGILLSSTLLKTNLLFEDIIHVDDKLIVEGGIAVNNKYLSYQDHKYLNDSDQKLGVSIILKDTHSFYSNKYSSVELNVDMNEAIKNGLFDATTDVLNIKLNNGDIIIHDNLIKDNDLENSFTISFEMITKGTLTYQLFINNIPEAIQILRSEDIIEDSHVFNELFISTNNLVEINKEFLIESVVNNNLSFTLEDSLFNILNSEYIEYSLVNNDKSELSNWVSFDENNRSINLDLSSFTTNERISLLNSLELILISYDKYGNHLEIDIKFNVQESNEEVTSIDREIINQIKIYPTLVDKKLTINHSTNQNFTYQIIDINGQNIKNGKVNGNIELNTAQLKSGIYIIKIISGQQLSTFKVIKQ